MPQVAGETKKDGKDPLPAVEVASTEPILTAESKKEHVTLDVSTANTTLSKEYSSSATTSVDIDGSKSPSTLSTTPTFCNSDLVTPQQWLLEGPEIEVEEVSLTTDMGNEFFFVEAKGGKHVQPPKKMSLADYKRRRSTVEEVSQVASRLTPKPKSLEKDKDYLCQTDTKPAPLVSKPSKIELDEEGTLGSITQKFDSTNTLATKKSSSKKFSSSVGMIERMKILKVLGQKREASASEGGDGAIQRTQVVDKRSSNANDKGSTFVGPPSDRKSDLLHHSTEITDKESSELSFSHSSKTSAKICSPARAKSKVCVANASDLLKPCDTDDSSPTASTTKFSHSRSHLKKDESSYAHGPSTEQKRVDTGKDGKEANFESVIKTSVFSVQTRSILSDSHKSEKEKKDVGHLVPAMKAEKNQQTELDTLLAKVVQGKEKAVPSQTESKSILEGRETSSKLGEGLEVSSEVIGEGIPAEEPPKDNSQNSLKRTHSSSSSAIVQGSRDGKKDSKNSPKSGVGARKSSKDISEGIPAVKPHMQNLPSKSTHSFSSLTEVPRSIDGEAQISPKPDGGTVESPKEFAGGIPTVKPQKDNSPIIPSRGMSISSSSEMQACTDSEKNSQILVKPDGDAVKSPKDIPAGEPEKDNSQNLNACSSSSPAKVQRNVDSEDISKTSPKPDVGVEESSKVIAKDTPGIEPQKNQSQNIPSKSTCSSSASSMVQKSISGEKMSPSNDQDSSDSAKPLGDSDSAKSEQQLCSVGNVLNIPVQHMLSPFPSHPFLSRPMFAGTPWLPPHPSLPIPPGPGTIYRLPEPPGANIYGSSQHTWRGYGGVYPNVPSQQHFFERSVMDFHRKVLPPPDHPLQPSSITPRRSSPPRTFRTSRSRSNSRNRSHGRSRSRSSSQSSNQSTWDHNEAQRQVLLKKLSNASRMLEDLENSSIQVSSQDVGVQASPATGNCKVQIGSGFKLRTHATQTQIHHHHCHIGIQANTMPNVCSKHVQKNSPRCRNAYTVTPKVQTSNSSCQTSSDEDFNAEKSVEYLNKLLCDPKWENVRSVVKCFLSHIGIGETEDPEKEIIDIVASDRSSNSSDDSMFSNNLREGFVPSPVISGASNISEGDLSDSSPVASQNGSPLQSQDCEEYKVVEHTLSCTELSGGVVDDSVSEKVSEVGCASSVAVLDYSSSLPIWSEISKVSSNSPSIRSSLPSASYTSVSWSTSIPNVTSSSVTEPIQIPSLGGGHKPQSKKYIPNVVLPCSPSPTATASLYNTVSPTTSSQNANFTHFLSQSFVMHTSPQPTLSPFPHCPPLPSHFPQRCSTPQYHSSPTPIRPASLTFMPPPPPAQMTMASKKRGTVSPNVTPSPSHPQRRALSPLPQAINQDKAAPHSMNNRTGPQVSIQSVSTLVPAPPPPLLPPPSTPECPGMPPPLVSTVASETSKDSTFASSNNALSLVSSELPQGKKKGDGALSQKNIASRTSKKMSLQLSPEHSSQLSLRSEASSKSPAKDNVSSFDRKTNVSKSTSRVQNNSPGLPSLKCVSVCYGTSSLDGANSKEYVKSSPMSDGGSLKSKTGGALGTADRKSTPKTDSAKSTQHSDAAISLITRTNSKCSPKSDQFNSKAKTATNGDRNFNANTDSRKLISGTDISKPIRDSGNSELVSGRISSSDNDISVSYRSRSGKRKTRVSSRQSRRRTLEETSPRSRSRRKSDSGRDKRRSDSFSHTDSQTDDSESVHRYSSHSHSRQSKSRRRSRSRRSRDPPYSSQSRCQQSRSESRRKSPSSSRVFSKAQNKESEKTNKHSITSPPSSSKFSQSSLVPVQRKSNVTAADLLARKREKMSMGKSKKSVGSSDIATSTTGNVDVTRSGVTGLVNESQLGDTPKEESPSSPAIDMGEVMLNFRKHMEGVTAKHAPGSPSPHFTDGYQQYMPLYCYGSAVQGSGYQFPSSDLPNPSNSCVKMQEESIAPLPSSPPFVLVSSPRCMSPPMSPTPMILCSPLNSPSPIVLSPHIFVPSSTLPVPPPSLPTPYPSLPLIRAHPPSPLPDSSSPSLPQPLPSSLPQPLTPSEPLSELEKSPQVHLVKVTSPKDDSKQDDSKQDDQVCVQRLAYTSEEKSSVNDEAVMLELCSKEDKLELVQTDETTPKIGEISREFSLLLSAPIYQSSPCEKMSCSVLLPNNDNTSLSVIRGQVADVLDGESMNTANYPSDSEPGQLVRDGGQVEGKLSMSSSDFKQCGLFPGTGHVREKCAEVEHNEEVAPPVPSNPLELSVEDKKGVKADIEALEVSSDSGVHKSLFTMEECACESPVVDTHVSGLSGFLPKSPLMEKDNISSSTVRNYSPVFFIQEEDSLLELSLTIDSPLSSELLSSDIQIKEKEEMLTYNDPQQPGANGLEVDNVASSEHLPENESANTQLLLVTESDDFLEELTVKKQPDFNTLVVNGVDPNLPKPVLPMSELRFSDDVVVDNLLNESFRAGSSIELGSHHCTRTVSTVPDIAEDRVNGVSASPTSHPSLPENSAPISFYLGRKRPSVELININNIISSKRSKKDTYSAFDVPNKKETCPNLTCVVSIPVTTSKKLGRGGHSFQVVPVVQQRCLRSHLKLYKQVPETTLDGVSKLHEGFVVSYPLHSLNLSGVLHPYPHLHSGDGFEKKGFSNMAELSFLLPSTPSATDRSSSCADSAPEVSFRDSLLNPSLAVSPKEKSHICETPSPVHGCFVKSKPALHRLHLGLRPSLPSVTSPLTSPLMSPILSLPSPTNPAKDILHEGFWSPDLAESIEIPSTDDHLKQKNEHPATPPTKLPSPAGTSALLTMNTSVEYVKQDHDESGNSTPKRTTDKKITIIFEDSPKSTATIRSIESIREKKKSPSSEVSSGNRHYRKIKLASQVPKKSVNVDSSSSLPRSGVKKSSETIKHIFPEWKSGSFLSSTESTPHKLAISSEETSIKSLFSEVVGGSRASTSECTPPKLFTSSEETTEVVDGSSDTFPEVPCSSAIKKSHPTPDVCNIGVDTPPVPLSSSEGNHHVRKSGGDKDSTVSSLGVTERNTSIKKFPLFRKSINTPYGGNWKGKTFARPRRGISGVGFKDRSLKSFDQYDNMVNRTVDYNHGNVTVRKNSTRYLDPLPPRPQLSRDAGGYSSCSFDSYSPPVRPHYHRDCYYDDNRYVDSYYEDQDDSYHEDQDDYSSQSFTSNHHSGYNSSRPVPAWSHGHPADQRMPYGPSSTQPLLPSPPERYYSPLSTYQHQYSKRWH